MAATHRLEATTLSSIDGISFTALSGHFTAEIQYKQGCDELYGFRDLFWHRLHSYTWLPSRHIHSWKRTNVILNEHLDHSVCKCK
jgi:hypothetical protein